jgi:predicted AlkP superfamily pyrophosphatase or phosphodiesterase
MTRAGLVTVFVLAACGGRAAGGEHADSPSAPPPGASRVVVISVDGMMPDVYLQPDAHGMQVPTLRKLVAGGAAARVHGVMPTVTYPSHTALVTGVPPKLHGIVGNRPLDVLDKNRDGWWWYAEDIHVPTLYSVLEAQHRDTALISWPVSVGAHASVLIPEIWRADTADDQKLLRALSTPGVLDEVARAEPQLWQYLTPSNVKDHAQMAIARYVLAHRHPELTLVHIFQLDHEQHEHAPWSAEAKARLEAIDGELAGLLADLQRSPDWPRTKLVVVSDHGFAPIEHELAINALFVQRGLIRVDAKGAPVSADVGVVTNGGTAFVYVLDPSKRAAVDAAVGELGDLVTRRIDHDALVALGGDPQATFALVAAPGYGFAGRRTGVLVGDLPSPHGTHGWPPDDPAMAASFIAFGPGVPHVDLGTIDMLDIAPTLARWLAIPLPSAVGRPLPALVR